MGRERKKKAWKKLEVVAGIRGKVTTQLFSAVPANTHSKGII